MYLNGLPGSFLQWTRAEDRLGVENELDLIWPCQLVQAGSREEINRKNEEMSYVTQDVTHAIIPFIIQDPALEQPG